ncbi:MAG: hypothetical protein MI892_18215 [Desulfobacterales bacterium]|nr:hypothetical protein [Desulfobacterales bacterium]
MFILDYVMVRPGFKEENIEYFELFLQGWKYQIGVNWRIIWPYGGHIKNIIVGDIKNVDELPLGDNS